MSDLAAPVEADLAPFVRERFSPMRFDPGRELTDGVLPPAWAELERRRRVAPRRRGPARARPSYAAAARQETEQMTSPHRQNGAHVMMRPLAATALLAAGTVVLSGCGGSEEGSSAVDRDRLCQTVRAESASLAGARDHLKAGAFYAEDADAYGQSTRQILDVIASGATDSDAAEATLDLLDAQSRVRGFIVANADAGSYDAGALDRLLANETSALDGVESACR